MDEDIAIINRETRIKKIKDFFFNNKKIIIVLLSIIIILIFAYFIFQDINKKNKIKLSNQFNKAIISFSIENKKNTEEELIKIINKKDITYSPLALYFLIDNNIIKENSKVNGLFDILINETKLEKEIKNLIIYKKGLFNSEFENENNLMLILNPLIKSESIWKSHALYLIAEYFFNKNQKQKAKEFYTKILTYEKSNENIKFEAQKRLSRDLSE